MKTRFLPLWAALLMSAVFCLPAAPAHAQVTRVTTGRSSSPTLIPRQAYLDYVSQFFYVGDPVTGLPLNCGFPYVLSATGDLLYDSSGTPTRLPIGTGGYF